MTLLPAGYNLYSPEYLREGIAEDAWDAGRFDATVVGGITPALELLLIADDADLPIELQSWGYTLTQAVNLHLMLANAEPSSLKPPCPRKFLSSVWRTAICLIAAAFLHPIALAWV